MVEYPNFKLLANGSDVTQDIQKHIKEITFKDNANNQSDALTLKVAGDFRRPKYKDELKLYFGYGNKLTFIGLFLVQSSVRVDNHTLEINATSVDFSQSLKIRRDVTYEKLSLKDICSQIASRHHLKLKCDYDDMFYTSKVQHNESDISFLNRLAKDINAIFNIKNNTLIFLKKIKNNEKNSTLPAYIISAKDMHSIQIKHSNKTLYASAKASWHDTQENKTKTITVGSDEPTIVIKDVFSNEAEAKSTAQAKLHAANSGIVSGTFKIRGDIIYAGGILNLTDTLEDDGKYQIKSVNHTFNDNGWTISLDFED